VHNKDGTSIADQDHPQTVPSIPERSSTPEIYTGYFLCPSHLLCRGNSHRQFEIMYVQIRRSKTEGASTLTLNLKQCADFLNS
jgi:hypothetical protein